MGDVNPVGAADDPFRVALDQLLDYGLDVESIETDGVLRRVQHRDDKRGKKDGWYVAHEFVAKSGRRLVVGSYGWWKEGESRKLKADARGLSEADRSALAQQRRAMAAQVKKARTQKAAEAAERAASIWDGLQELGQSEYLRRKSVGINGVRFARDQTVVVPLRGVDGLLTGLQFIAADGGKKFLTGTAVTGAFHMMGKPAVDLPLVVAEGYATAAAVHQATGWPCAVAFDCGNLRPVCEALRRANPTARMLVAGDDDAATSGNPGRTKALAAAEAVGGEAVFPDFSGIERGTDWNDLWCAIGPAATRAQLLRVTGKTESPPPPSDGGGVSFDFSLAAMLDDFVLIYTTETVFDGRINRVISLASLRVAAGRDLVKIWLEHPERRLVMPENVVFDPSGDVSVGQVNLFRGWPVAPERNGCEKQLEMLYYLCGESDKVFDWLLKWCAYPLQHPGAKMRTCVVMHGPEGTGKNLWWGAVRDIYGEYGTIITQTELESQFNAWASRKMFVIGNEVVSRAEMYHQKGRLKNMITEPDWLINEKMLPTRMEANHANFVFLSNVIRPAAPDPDDRRYMVVWTPPKLDQNYYNAVVTEQRRVGPGALYDYLLRYDLGDFTEHTKPVETEAKRDLIEASMDGPDLFWLQWSSGELDAPFIPCRVSDLYEVYMKWSRAQGEPYAASNKVFGVILGKRLRRIITTTWSSFGKKKGRMYVPHGWQPEAGADQAMAMGKCLDRFRKLGGLELD